MDAAAEGEKGGRGGWWAGHLIARGNATCYNNTSAKKIGVTRVGFQVVLSITQQMFPQKKLKLIFFILTRRGGSCGVHASPWWSHKS